MPQAPQPQHAPEGAADAVAPAVATAVAALEGSGARWALLRGTLADDAGDVDVLVHPDDLAPAEAALAGAGFSRWPAWGRGSHRFHLGYDAPSDSWAKVDLVTELAFGPFGELATGVTPAVLDRRRPGAGCPVLAPDDAFWALLLHALLDRGAVPDRHRAALAAEAAEGAGGPLRAALGPVLPAGEAEDLLEAAAAGNVALLEAAGARLRVRWAAEPDARRRRRRGRVARRLAALPVAAGRRGVSVALLGPDGAGKSTLAAAVAGTPALRARSIYAGLYGAATPPPRVPVPGLRLAGRVARLWRLRARAAAWRIRGRVVVFDRHGLDAAVAAPAQPAGAATRARRRLLAAALPEPDVLIVLDAPGEVLLARKGEHDVSTLEAQRARYRALAEQRGAVVLDATADADAVRREVTDVVWRRWTAGWRR